MPQGRNVACERMNQACMFTKEFWGLSHLAWSSQGQVRTQLTCWRCCLGSCFSLSHSRDCVLWSPK